MKCKKALFQPGLSTLHGYKAKIHVDPAATPKFCKARPIPYVLCGKVETELERLTREGIIEPVQFADWAAPIVPVLKSDKESLLVALWRLQVDGEPGLETRPIPHPSSRRSLLSSLRWEHVFETRHETSLSADRA